MQTPAEDVLNRHIGAFALGIEAVMADYGDDAILVTETMVYRGKAAIRSFFEAFMSTASEEFWAAFGLRSKVVEGDVAYLTWSAPPFVALGVDTLIVRDDRIVLQTFASC